MSLINELRKKMKKTDASIIKMLAIRQNLSKELGQLKQDSGMSVIDLAQEKKQFEFYKSLCDKYDLPDELVCEVFKLLISNSRLIQKF